LLPPEFVTIAVAEVVITKTAVLHMCVVADKIFGAAILTPHYY
jgi:hypothetical protein